MSSEDFLRLTYDEQIHLLSIHGIYIGKRGKRPVVAVLYQLDSFYVEITYLKYRLHIATIRTYTCTSVLDAYFEAYAPLPIF